MTISTAELLQLTIEALNTKGGIIFLGVIIARIAYSIGRGQRRRRRRFEDDYYDERPFRRGRRRGDPMLSFAVLAICSTLLLIGIYNYTKADIPQVVVHEEPEYAPLSPSLGFIDLEEEKPEAQTPETENNFTPEREALRLVSYDERIVPETQDSYTDAAAQDFIQVAALPSMEDALTSQEKYSKQYPGMVYLARSNIEEGYPYKVLVGSFQNEAAARHALSSIKGYYKNLGQDQLTLISSQQKIIY